MVLLWAELAMYLLTKDVTLNGDVLAARSEHKRLWCFKTCRFQVPPETNTERGSEVQYTPCPLGS